MAAQDQRSEAAQVKTTEGRLTARGICSNPGPGDSRQDLSHHSLVFKDSKLICKEMVNTYVCFDMENHSHLFLIHLRKG